jgi:hypothetical protein
VYIPHICGVAPVSDLSDRIDERGRKSLARPPAKKCSSQKVRGCRYGPCSGRFDPSSLAFHSRRTSSHLRSRPIREPEQLLLSHIVLHSITKRIPTYTTLSHLTSKMATVLAVGVGVAAAAFFVRPSGIDYAPTRY